MDASVRGSPEKTVSPIWVMTNVIRPRCGFTLGIRWGSILENSLKNEEGLLCWLFPSKGRKRKKPASIIDNATDESALRLESFRGFGIDWLACLLACLKWFGSPNRTSHAFMSRGKIRTAPVQKKWGCHPTWAKLWNVYEWFTPHKIKCWEARRNPFSSKNHQTPRFKVQCNEGEPFFLLSWTRWWDSF